ncbi:MAG: primosomal protein N' [Polyangiaceae bacterium]|nr:primosomal protein N' [Polyangiaceae bacterium]
MMGDGAGETAVSQQPSSQTSHHTGVRSRALLAQVAVPVPLSRAFTYLVPPEFADRVVPGVRCICQFHRRLVVGVVVDVSDAELPSTTVLPIEGLVDDEPSVPEELLRFLQKLASYYMVPIGEVMQAALPSIERRRAEQKKGQLALLARPEAVVGEKFRQVAHATALSSGSMKLRGATAMVLSHLRAVGPMAVARLCDLFPNARAAIKRLVALGLVTVEREPVRDGPMFRDVVPRGSVLEPTEPQRVAIETIVAAIEAESSQAFLLHGITGSGKTEVYLRAIEACLRMGRGALVMVPEIALTPQLITRFRSRFGDDVAVVHSGLTARARYETWRALRQGRLTVAIGARSSVFSPVPKLGLIVVDEEHDGSFKQEDGVRYHGRDMAMLRAHLAGAVCVLGSATPSMESERLAELGRLKKLRLPGRATAAKLPTVELVDLRRTGGVPSGHSMLSIPLHRAIERALSAGEQAIVFLNRRGFAPSMQCDGCGLIIECPVCSVSSTLHLVGGPRLRCHYCDREAPVPEVCTSCGCPRIAMLGLGTERLEQVFHTAFPTARVERLDRDVASGMKSEAVIDKMRRKEADILVGTQMVTKGHDLPDVTVVGVINADAALSLPDFRASERTFQLLVQVAGRAGRAQRPGRVIVQTRIPDHPVLVHARNHDVESFAKAEMANRMEAGYPPFTRLALVRFDSADADLVAEEAGRIAVAAREQVAKMGSHVEVLGPSPAPIERLRGRYRYRLLLRSVDRAALRSVVAAVLGVRASRGRLVRMTVDIDPVHMM